MKRTVLLSVAFYTIGLLAACKGGTANDASDSANQIDLANDYRIYDIVKRNDTLLVVCDPEGLFWGQPLSGGVSTEWIKSTYHEPDFKTLTDSEMFPHEDEDGVCSCGVETFWVVGKKDTLCFQEETRPINDNFSISTDLWEYICGHIRDTLIDFGGYRVGMSIQDVAERLHLPKDIDIIGRNVFHLVAPNFFDEPIYEEGVSYNHVIGHSNPYEYSYFDVPRISYAGVELRVKEGKVFEISTGWYTTYGIVWGQ